MSQSLSKIYLHAVYSTKNRIALLEESWRDELFCVIGGIVNGVGCQSLIVGGHVDHVHVLFQLSRTIAVADVLKSMKSLSSKWINDTRRMPSHFHWQNGYAIFSVSHSMIDIVREYIRQQPDHHRKMTFQDELRELLRKHDCEWDERYVWD